MALLSSSADSSYHHTIPLHSNSGPFWAGKTVALFGGSFNPPHEGHRHIADLALKNLKCDFIWWLVSPGNPLKNSKNNAPFQKRFDQTQKWANHPQMLVTDLENQLGTRYTYDSLQKIKHRFPQTRFIWIMGEDNLYTLHRWHKWREIFDMVPVVIFHRREKNHSRFSFQTLEQLEKYKVSPCDVSDIANRQPPCWTLLYTKKNSESSTRIRNMNGANRKK